MRWGRLLAAALLLLPLAGCSTVYAARVCGWRGAVPGMTCCCGPTSGYGSFECWPCPKKEGR